MGRTKDHGFQNPIALYRKIKGVWSADTASPPSSWSPSVRAKNHCSVTALVVQDYFGGDILRTETACGAHFYNRIDGQRWDLTMSQFDEPIPYDDTPSSREAAMRDTTAEIYRMVCERLCAAVERG